MEHTRTELNLQENLLVNLLMDELNRRAELWLSQ